jgi:hypothetical protein
MALFTRTRTNPVFYADRLAVMLREEPERLERMRTEPRNVDLLTWNVFSSLDTHRDQEWLAYRLQLIGGSRLRPPVRISLFSGARRAPFLRPSISYLDAIHRRVGEQHHTRDGVAAFEQPFEVPVRIETPDVLLLVDSGRARLRAGAGGRDRLAEIVDAGLEHARRLSSLLSVALIVDDDSDVLASRVPQLSSRDGIRRLLPWRDEVPRVDVHGIGWSAVLRLWWEERDHLDLDGEPVKAFRSYATR